MIERYTIKVAPAVSQKEILKQLNEGEFDESKFAKLHQIKARIDLLCDPADVKKIGELLKELSGTAPRYRGVCFRATSAMWAMFPCAHSFFAVSPPWSAMLNPRRAALSALKFFMASHSSPPE